MSFDQGKTWQEVWTSSMGDYARMYIDLDEFFPRTAPARYNYLLRFDLANPGLQPDVGLKRFYLRSTLQMARLAMPGLGLGDNEFVYTDQSTPERKVKITHSWAECDAPVVPARPSGSALSRGWRPGQWHARHFSLGTICHRSSRGRL